MSAASTPPPPPPPPAAAATPHPAMAYSKLLPFIDLYLAALTGDWAAAKRFLRLNPEAVRAKITRCSETALHIAVGAKQTNLVEKLVRWMLPADLELKNDVGDTVLHLAAVSGIKRIAEVVVSKNPNLLQIRGSKDLTPLHMAALLGHKEMVWYLYHESDQILGYRERVGLLMAAIAADLHDVALEIIQKYPEMALARVDENGETALHVMARKPSVFYFASPLLELLAPTLSRLGSILRLFMMFFWVPYIIARLSRRLEVFRDRTLVHKQATELVKQLWKNVLSSENDSKLNELIRMPSNLLFTAAELGNINFLTILLRTNPHLFWEVDEKNRSIFHIAVLYRHENVFRLIFEIGGLKESIAAYIDKDNNNMLHLAAKLAPDHRLNLDTGAALQYRRELHWFKVVENVVQPLHKEMKNSDEKTPKVLFTEEHKQLKQQGEEWMKGTATSCMLVATLIATVMFAAFSTIPGGNNSRGFPIFLGSKAFYLFAISDALSVFSSATSVLCFLSILTSGYNEEEFHHVLPYRLRFGLITLFISIVTMMTAFIASLTIVLGPALKRTSPIVGIMAGLIFIVSILPQFSLLADLLISNVAVSRMSYGPTAKECLLLEAEIEPSLFRQLHRLFSFK